MTTLKKIINLYKTCQLLMTKNIFNEKEKFI